MRVVFLCCTHRVYSKCPLCSCSFFFFPPKYFVIFNPILVDNRASQCVWCFWSYVHIVESNCVSYPGCCVNDGCYRLLCIQQPCVYGPTRLIKFCVNLHPVWVPSNWCSRQYDILGPTAFSNAVFVLIGVNVKHGTNANNVFA